MCVCVRGGVCVAMTRLDWAIQMPARALQGEKRLDSSNARWVGALIARKHC
jgi:hypothetical protein